MKNSLDHIAVYTLSLLMFFTSVGFTVDLHYCQGNLKTFSFFGKAKTCHDIGKGMKNCPHHKKMIAEDTIEDRPLKKNGCCSNKTISFQTDQDLPNHGDKTVVISSKLKNFAVAIVQVFIQISDLETDTPTFRLYNSPLIPRDIYVLLEAYLL